MRRILQGIAALMLLASSAHSTDLKVPKNLQDRWIGHSMGLALAEACSRKLNKPQIFKDAIAAFVKFSNDNGIEGGEATIRKSAKAAAVEASSGDASMFMATPEACRKIEAGSRRELGR